MQKGLDLFINLRSIENQCIEPAVADAFFNRKTLAVFSIIKNRHQIQPFLNKLHTYAIVNITLYIMVCKACEIL